MRNIFISALFRNNCLLDTNVYLGHTAFQFGCWLESNTSPIVRWRSTNRRYTGPFGSTSTYFDLSLSKVSSSRSKTSIEMSGKRKKGLTEAESSPTIKHVSSSLLPKWMNIERTNVLTTSVVKPKSKTSETQCVYYWMHREMRAVDNWALLFARHLAEERDVPLRVIYALPPPPSKSRANKGAEMENAIPPKVIDMNMTMRHGLFLIEGLQCVEQKLSENNIPLHILKPNSHMQVGQCVFDSTSNDALAVVCDFNPLRHVREWMEVQSAPLFSEKKIPLIQVDAHNVVPVWHASPKREVGARTLRPKITKLLSEFLTDFPNLKGNSHKPIDTISTPQTDWKQCEEYLKLDNSVKPVNDCFRPGTQAAMDRFNTFLNSTSSGEGLRIYDTHRNNPNYNQVCSNMSPWINYGHVAFQRLALMAQASPKKYSNQTASFVEEGIIRRELSDNFVYYARDNYDDLNAAAEWARASLEIHSSDEREYIYTLEEFEKGATHDDLWNAAQVSIYYISLERGRLPNHCTMRICILWCCVLLYFCTAPTLGRG